MRQARCTRCGNHGPCVMAGPNGQWVCQECLYLEAMGRPRPSKQR